MSLADRVVLMRDGRIVQVGTPAKMFERPADAFAGFFIGSPSMNFIDVYARSGWASSRRSRRPPEALRRRPGGAGWRRCAQPPPRYPAAARRAGQRPGVDAARHVRRADPLDQYAIGRERYFDFAAGRRHAARHAGRARCRGTARGRVRLDARAPAHSEHRTAAAGPAGRCDG